MSIFRATIKGILVSALILILSSSGKAETAGGNVTESPEKIVDNFDTLTGWEAIEPPGTRLKLSTQEDTKRKTMCLDYDFGETNSYVVASKEFQISLPQNYKFSFYVKRNVPANNIEFKLIDANGNTFWKKWYAFASVNKWKKMVVSKDDLTFAWGPKPGEKLKEVKKIEFAVSGVTGKGQVCISDFVFTPLASGIPAQKAEPVASKSYYPRWLSDQGSYWTMVGVPDDSEEALFCEDGTIEPYKRGFSIAPFLYLDNKLITRDEAKITQSLEKGYLPIPAVQWAYENVLMDAKIFAYGKAGESAAYICYTVRNEREEEVNGKLFLAIDPYQVYPPWQGGGGISLIREIDYSKGILIINEKDKIYPLTKPDNFGAQREADSSPEGNVIDFIMNGTLPDKQAVKDEGGFVSAAIEYDFNLKPRESKNFFVLIPLYDKKPDISLGMKEGRLKGVFGAKLKEIAAYWEEKVNKVEIDIPDIDMVNTLKSNTAYNLITKDGPALQPGSRSYDKAWMRDGGSAANALLEMGLTKEPKDFIEWFSGYQFESGEIPPIIDTKAKDPLWEEKQNKLVEYDSQGEFIWAVLQYYHFTKDREFLEEMLPKIVKDLEFLVYLRSQRLTPEYENGPDEKKIFYGILPESTSHEGYDKKHSYWDDFWALKGWKDARTIARILERDDLINWIDKEYSDFRKSVYDSINLVMKIKNINYIPGCAELGDNDATSTAAAITYCGELDYLPQPQLKSMFDKYYNELRGRFNPKAQYRFTPYELRSAPAFLYMDQKDRALALLRFMLKCRRPLAWNHLAEVVHSDYRFPTYIGDMPHTWVGAEYINAVRSLFAYELNDKLVLGHGIDEEWLLSEKGVSVKNMPTYYGNINYTARKDKDTLKIRVWGTDVVTPPNGFIFKLPQEEAIGEINLNGEILKGFSVMEVVFYKLPADIVVHFK